MYLYQKSGETHRQSVADSVVYMHQFVYYRGVESTIRMATNLINYISIATLNNYTDCDNRFALITAIHCDLMSPSSTSWWTNHLPTLCGVDIINIIINNKHTPWLISNNQRSSQPIDCNRSTSRSFNEMAISPESDRTGRSTLPVDWSTNEWNKYNMDDFQLQRCNQTSDHLIGYLLDCPISQSITCAKSNMAEAADHPMWRPSRTQLCSHKARGTHWWEHRCPRTRMPDFLHHDDSNDHRSTRWIETTNE